MNTYEVTMFVHVEAESMEQAAAQGREDIHELALDAAMIVRRVDGSTGRVWIRPDGSSDRYDPLGIEKHRYYEEN